MNKELNTPIKNYNHFGFIIPKNAKFWKINDGKFKGKYAFEIGRHWHDCHVDSTEIIVLFIIYNTSATGLNCVYEGFSEDQLSKY